MSKKMIQMDKEIEEIQSHNRVLEARVLQLEASVDEMEEPVEEIKITLENFYKSGVYPDSPTPDSNPTVTVQKFDPKISAIIEVAMVEAPVTKILISKVQIEQLDQLQDIYKVLRVIPNSSSDGSMDGYRLAGIPYDSITHQLGLRNGDILVAVNGQSVYLQSDSQVKQAWQAGKDSGTFTFLIERRNRYQILHYDLEK